MDPDATLNEIRELVGSNTDEDVSRLCELAKALDEWIVQGGFLPATMEAK